MTQRLTGLLVGSHFRPPAKQVVGQLPNDTPLLLRPEPTNDYDPDAVGVYIDAGALAQRIESFDDEQLEAFEQELLGCGWTLELLLAEPDLQLGYLARAGNRALAKLPQLLPAVAIRQAIEAAQVVQANLAWGPNGEATISCVFD